jgi:hypothetical protein
MKTVGTSVHAIRESAAFAQVRRGQNPGLDTMLPDVERLRMVILAIGAAYDEYAQSVGKDDEETQDAFAVKVRNLVKNPRTLRHYIVRARKDRQATRVVGKAAAKLAKEGVG